MNIFFRELKSHRNSLIFWSIGMFALVGASIAKYAAYSGTDMSMSKLIDQFPKMIQVVFGINGFDLSTASGFFGIIFMYIALMGGVHAVLLGSDLISKEERDRTSEFLFVKPVSRIHTITAKLMAGFVNLVVVNLVTLFSSIYLVRNVNKGVSADHDILVMMAGLFFFQLIFFSIGAFIAGMSKKPRSASGAATTAIMASFILFILVNMSDKLDFLKYLTPFKYFDARNMLADKSLNFVYVGLSLVIVVISLAGTYYFYNKRDLKI